MDWPPHGDVGLVMAYDEAAAIDSWNKTVGFLRRLGP